MRKHTRTLVLLTALILLFAAPVWSQVTIVAPVTSNPAINTEIDLVIGTFATDLNDAISEYYHLPLLAQGIGNSGATSTHIGTQRAFIDYKRFSIVVGGGFAGSLPRMDLQLIENAASQLEQGDLYFGAALQPVVASFGFRPRFISDRLYINAKLGYTDIEDGVIEEGIAYNALSVGLLANYQIIETRSLPLGFLRWRGVSLGSGLMYQRNELSIELGFDEVSESFTEGSETYYVTLEPTITAIARSESIVIPLEVTTGLRVLWVLDLNVGGGVDLSFGSSDVSLAIDSPVLLEGNTSGLDVTPGSANVDAGTLGKGPQFVRPRLTAGFGLNLGPLKVDVPLMYYFDQEGNSFMAGVNVGIVW